MEKSNIPNRLRDALHDASEAMNAEAKAEINTPWMRHRVSFDEDFAAMNATFNSQSLVSLVNTDKIGGRVSSVKCHFSTVMMIRMHQFEDICHNSMPSYANIVSKSVYHGSNVLFLGVLSWCFIKPCCHNTMQ